MASTSASVALWDIMGWTFVCVFLLFPAISFHVSLSSAIGTLFLEQGAFKLIVSRLAAVIANATK